MNKALPVVLGVGVVGTVLLVMAARKAEAAPEVPPEIPPEVPIEPMPEVPTRSDILTAADFQQLDDYYNQISLLYRSWKITFEEYMNLYYAYVQRFYELWEAL